MKLFYTNAIASLMVVSAISFTTPAVATIFTQGDLSYDDTTNIISGNKKEYLGFSVGAGWDYATTLANTSDGGLYADFNIATTNDADFFIGSLFGSFNDTCSTASAPALGCGVLVGWLDGKLGDNSYSSFDRFFFIADRFKVDVGLVRIQPSGYVDQYESWSNFESADYYGAEDKGGRYISWLLVRDIHKITLISEPSILTLMGLGIFGLGLSRRKMKK